MQFLWDKAMKLGMKGFRGKLRFNIQFAHMSSALTAFFNPYRKFPPMPLSLNNCPSTIPYQSPNHVSSTSIEQNVYIQENLNIASSKNRCDFQHQAHGKISGGIFTISIQVNGKRLHGTILKQWYFCLVSFKGYCWGLQAFFEIFKSRFVEPPSLCKLQGNESISHISCAWKSASQQCTHAISGYFGRN